MDTLLDTVPCGFLSTRDDGSITLMNRTLQTRLGYPLDTILGKHIDDILPAALGSTGVLGANGTATGGRR